ncbi:hypothetical protein SS05631_a44100 (plasmid) [Sinorhizobium sp. CCBAU 05631]|nr:hypothetical protein SS05631_a44100 [Sinorhizobium sp. CCBAU 05631]
MRTSMDGFVSVIVVAILFVGRPSFVPVRGGSTIPEFDRP